MLDVGDECQVGVFVGVDLRAQFLFGEDVVVEEEVEVAEGAVVEKSVVGGGGKAEGSGKVWRVGGGAGGVAEGVEGFCAGLIPRIKVSGLILPACGRGGVLAKFRVGIC